MNNVYVLVEEREDSVACKIHGIWEVREDACRKMLQLVSDNAMFSEKSYVSTENGIAESDPDYCDEEYCNYSINKYPVLSQIEHTPIHSTVLPS